MTIPSPLTISNGPVVREAVGGNHSEKHQVNLDNAGYFAVSR